MNVKIEIKYLNITNYPYVEEYLEDMASSGWLISKIILGSIFIFRKIEPQELEFSISPYEVETAFSRKSKEELIEFQSLCESVGWNYCTESYDLHIYFKKKGADALDIHTDEEEEFKLLEKIGKKQLKNYYFIVPFLLLALWLNCGKISSNIHSMKDGLSQIILPIIPIGLSLAIADWIHIGRFLDKNRKNMDLGKDIEYSDSRFYFYRFSFIATFIFTLVFMIYILYMFVFLKNKIAIIALLPILICIVIGQLYRIFIKPSKHSKGYKVGMYTVVVLAASILSISIGVINIGNLRNIGNRNNLDGDKYKVLVSSDFNDIDSEEETMIEKTSILVPKSYDYTSRMRGKDGLEYLITNYSEALTEELANKLVRLYVEQAENGIVGRYHPDLEYYYAEGNIPEENLRNMGLTRSDFNELKEKKLEFAVDESIERIKERSITKADNILWNADEVYFLRYDKSEIVLRKGKEVFYLSGKDFSDADVISITKERLGLE